MKKIKSSKILALFLVLSMMFSLAPSFSYAAGAPSPKGGGQTENDPRIVYTFAQMKEVLESEDYSYVQLGDGSAPINETITEGSDIHIKGSKYLTIQNTYPEPQRFISDCYDLNNLFVVDGRSDLIIENAASEQEIEFAPFNPGGAVILATDGEVFNYGVNLTGLASTVRYGYGYAVKADERGWYTGYGGDLKGTSDHYERNATAFYAVNAPESLNIFRGSLSITAENTKNPEKTAALVIENSRVSFNHPLWDMESEEVYFVQDYEIKPSDPCVSANGFAVHTYDGDSYISNTEYKVTIDGGMAITADTEAASEIKAHYGELVTIGPEFLDTFSSWLETEGYVKIDDINSASTFFPMITKDVYIEAQTAPREIIKITKQPYYNEVSKVLSIEATSANDGYAPAVYQWFYNDKNSNTDGKVFGAQGRSEREVTEHTITHTLDNGTYYLYCIVTDPNTDEFKTSETIALTLKDGKVIKEADKLMKFTDVKESDWYYEYVTDAVEKGLMNGLSETTFAPTGNATRAMVWTVMARIGNADLTGGEVWYSKAREWAMNEGVSDGTFPDDLITREQFITMLYRYSGEPQVSGDINFMDKNNVSYWAHDAVIWATDRGIISGGGNTILRPTDKLTRAEMATMLSKMTSN